MQTWNSIVNGEEVHLLKVLCAESSMEEGYWCSEAADVKHSHLYLDSDKLCIADRNGLASLWISIFQSYCE